MFKYSSRELQATICETTMRATYNNINSIYLKIETPGPATGSKTNVEVYMENVTKILLENFNDSLC